MRRILDTRKTTPGLRALEKQAVVAGGGVSHRDGLYDAILVKENHAALAGGVGEAASVRWPRRPARNGSRSRSSAPIELEEALDAGVAARAARQHDPGRAARVRRALADGRAELEASGGVTLETVRAIAETGVDFISVGALTHCAPALDLSLLLEPV